MMIYTFWMLFDNESTITILEGRNKMHVKDDEQAVYLPYTHNEISIGFDEINMIHSFCDWSAVADVGVVFKIILT